MCTDCESLRKTYNATVANGHIIEAKHIHNALAAFEKRHKEKSVVPDMDKKSILALTFYCDDLDIDISIKNYLKELLRTLWKEGEGFSGKRPFGNSGWNWDLAKPLIQQGVIKGATDSDGYLEWVDDAGYNKLILELIDEL